MAFKANIYTLAQEMIDGFGPKAGEYACERLAQRLIDATQLAGLLGLGPLFYGWAIYPPLAWPMAAANLAYLCALAIAWLIAPLHTPPVGAPPCSPWSIAIISMPRASGSSTRPSAPAGRRAVEQ